MTVTFCILRAAKDVARFAHPENSCETRITESGVLRCKAAMSRASGLHLLSVCGGRTLRTTSKGKSPSFCRHSETDESTKLLREVEKTCFVVQRVGTDAPSVDGTNKNVVYRSSLDHPASSWEFGNEEGGCAEGGRRLPKTASAWI